MYCHDLYNNEVCNKKKDGLSQSRQDDAFPLDNHQNIGDKAKAKEDNWTRRE